MLENTGIRGLISNINKGQGQPAMSIVRDDPSTAALISKLVRSRMPEPFDTRKAESFHKLDQGQMLKMSDSIHDGITDNENMMQLFPDIELAAQILVSSVLSPKDMVNVELILSTSEDILPADVTMKLIEIVRKECESYYKIKEQLSEIMTEVLFGAGSWIQAVIPESAVDELINGGENISTESMQLGMKDILTDDKKIKSLGFLGDPTVERKRTMTESLTIGTESNAARYQSFQTSLYSKEPPTKQTNLLDLVEVSDNFLLLKLPEVISRNNRDKSRKLINQKVGVEGRRGRSTRNLINTAIGNESQAPQITEKQLETMLYKGNQARSKIFTSIKTKHSTFRRSIGRPLYMRLPSMSVIPVHVPGDVRKRIGYFVLLDEEGNPVSQSSSQKLMQGVASGLSDSSSSVTSFLLQKAKMNLAGNERPSLSIDQAAGIYAGIVEADLVQRLHNGIYGSNVELAKNEEVYRIMLARTFANQFTRLVYIPGELVTYYAYKYHENGIGKSLLDGLKVLTSMRAILLFSEVMALSKNSIAVTSVNMVLDPADPDPKKTIEMSINEITKMRQQYFPLGINTPSDLVDWVQRAGFQFSFEGHPAIPQTKFEFENKQMNHTVPQSDLKELLQKQTIMGLGMSPETVDNGFGPDFATTATLNNILLSKRVIVIQDHMTPLITDGIQKRIVNDFVIREKLLDVLKENKGAIEKFLTDEEKEGLASNPEEFWDIMLDNFIEVLVADLPKPDITTLENQSTAYAQYEDALTKAIDAWIDATWLTQETAGDLSNNIDVLKSIIKAYYLRKWMADNGYMHELSEMVTRTEEGNPSVDLFDIVKTHVEGLMGSSTKFLASMNAIKEAANKDLANMGNDATAPENTSGSDDTGAGGDEFGFDSPADDTGAGDDTSTEDKPEDKPEGDALDL
jgi:hypothetical protein